MPDVTQRASTCLPSRNPCTMPWPSGCEQYEHDSIERLRVEMLSLGWGAVVVDVIDCCRHHLLLWFSCQVN